MGFLSMILNFDVVIGSDCFGGGLDEEMRAAVRACRRIADILNIILFILWFISKISQIFLTPSLEWNIERKYQYKGGQDPPGTQLQGRTLPIPYK